MLRCRDELFEEHKKEIEEKSAVGFSAKREDEGHFGEIGDLGDSFFGSHRASQGGTEQSVSAALQRMNS
jgi:hypothetical protein